MEVIRVEVDYTGCQPEAGCLVEVDYIGCQPEARLSGWVARAVESEGERA